MKESSGGSATISRVATTTISTPVNLGDASASWALVAVSTKGNTSLTSVKVGGKSCTQLFGSAQQFGGAFTTYWYLAPPTTLSGMQSVDVVLSSADTVYVQVMAMSPHLGALRSLAQG